MKIYVFLSALLLAQVVYSTQENEVKDEATVKGYMWDLGGHTYFFGDISTNIVEAEQDCATFGMKLVSLETVEKWTLIKDHLISMDAGEKMHWTSGRNIAIEPYVWSSTNQPVEYADWGANNPTFPSSPNCIYVAANYAWFDRWCFDKGPRYICE